jgi:threonine synthase
VKSLLKQLECARCGRVHDPDRLNNRCACGGTLLARYRKGVPSVAAIRARPPGPLRYRELLPFQEKPASLGEVETPLLPMPRLSERWGVEVVLKDDSPLPGGTFKARGAWAGLARALELGARRIVMPSAGNAGGAWALYAARAGVPLTVTMAKTAPAMNRAEVEAAGGDLVLVDGTIADAGHRAAEIARDTGAFLTATFAEPYRLEGKKSAWFETFDRLGEADMHFPRSVIVPVGGGVALVAAAKAAGEALQAGWATGDPPRLIGVQPDGCAPIARAFDEGADDVRPWGDVALTAAAGLRVPAPSEGRLVLDRVRASNGTMVAVAEDDILGAVRDLASSEGVFACPEGAATVAAAGMLARRGDLEGPVVLYNTGSGAKYAGLPSG